MFGYTLSYNTLDNNKNPTSGIFAELRQDIAGAGRQSKFVRTTADVRYYHEIFDQIVGIVHLQGGEIFGLAGQPTCASSTISTSGRAWCAALLRSASARATYPIRLSPGQPARRHHIFRRQRRSAVPDLGSAEGYRAEGRALRRCRHPVRLYRQDQFQSEWRVHADRRLAAFHAGHLHHRRAARRCIRSSVGASIIWSSPLGPIRFDFAKAITKSSSTRRSSSASLAAPPSDKASVRAHVRGARHNRPPRVRHRKSSIAGRGNGHRGEARMSEPVFFPRAAQTSLADIVACTGAAVVEGADLSTIVSGMALLDEAEPGELTFLILPKTPFVWRLAAPPPASSQRVTRHGCQSRPWRW